MKTMHRRSWLGLLGRGMLLSALLTCGGNAMSYEQPAYTVVGQAGGIEYRQYKPYLVSETVVSGTGDFDSAGNEGFRRLFNYIAGGNTSQSKISMTAPVEQTAQSEKSEKIAMTVPVEQTGSAAGWRVSFMMPTQYTLETAPVPTDPRVRVVQVPGRVVAALRYSGRWTESNYVEHRDELLQTLGAAGIKTSGEPWLARYNAPFSLPMMRRNEILIEIDQAPD